MKQSDRLSIETINGIIDAAGGFSSARPAILKLYQEHYQAARGRIADEFIASGCKNAALRHDYAKAVDELLGSIFELVTKKLYPLATPTSSERIALYAVGGYGRGEMAPFSDVDIVLLIPYKQTAWHENVIETILYLLWDLRIKLGYSVRGIDECLPLARDDYTIRTAMLESRFIAGDEALGIEALELLRNKLFVKTIPDFVEAKLQEREERHEKSGNIRYVLEPNVKEAKGGLRDLHTLYWLGKYITGADTPEELVQEGFFEADELTIFREAEEFLWAVRMTLHLASGRLNDLLSFDMQVEVARMMGYQDSAERRGVEKFMQDYFLAARHAGELTRVFLTELEARHAKRSRFRIGGLRRSLDLPEAFRFVNNRIDFSSETALVEDRLNILRIFTHALETGYLIHPNAFRLMARHHELIDDEFRKDKEANRLFVSLLLDYGNPERVLRRMNEIGILGAFIPAWEPVVAMMQYNMYHHFTVDEHTIQCISTLAKLEHGELEEELPISSEIIASGINRRVLYVALLLHDIGKGQARPHEIVGEEIARELCPRLGFEPYETDQVAWLVRHHLDMSDAAQKRDLSDPKTVSDFAIIAQDQETLDLLTVLTVCDIRGVGPKTWNNWKAMLLRELHALTSAHFKEGGVLSGADARELAAKNALSLHISNWDEGDVEKELDRHYRDYWLGLPTYAHVEIAELLRIDHDAHDFSNEPRIRLSPDEDRDATRISFVMPDHPGLFARICGAVSLSGANIVDARTYTSSDGMATAVLWAQDTEGAPFDPARFDLLRKNVIKILHGKVVTQEAIAQRSKIKKREREFKVPTKIKFDNDGSRIFTIIEIDTRDRLGLVYDIARSLSASNISISSAIIATYGEEAVDSFYVKDIFGLKITSPAKQNAIEERLRKAIEEGYQEALS